MLPDRQSGPDGRLLSYVLLSAGAVSLALAVIGCGPPVNLFRLPLSSVVEAVKLWRWVLLLAGWVLFPVGVLLLAIGRSTLDRDRRALTRNTLVFLGVVAGLAVTNYALMAVGRYYGAAYYFPISVFRGPEPHADGVLFAVWFLVLLCLALRATSRLNAVHVWVAGLGLIVLGNLAQGGVREAFRTPLAGSGVHYYHEALRIGEWREWLSGFNGVQESLGTHARTHPPFAVLIHYFLLRVLGRGVLPVAGVLTLLASLAVPLVRSIMRTLGASAERATQLALLFAVIPAFNVYSAVSLDGVVAMLGAAFLLGLVMILRRGPTALALVLFAAGLLLANALTFAGLLLVAVAGLIAWAEAKTAGRPHGRTPESGVGGGYGVAAATAVAAAFGLLVLWWFRAHFGYDHVGAFFTAAGLERALGGTLLRTPGVYVWTRAEDVIEIALFASAGIVAVLFRSRLLGAGALDIRDSAGRVFWAMAAVLAASFLLGTHRTGETARACLFCYPFLMVALRGLERPVVGALVLSAGVQTAAMQLTGAYFW